MDMLEAKEIRAIRESLNLTQTEFAVRVGVSASTVISWENGMRHPRWDTMKKINSLKPSDGKRREPAAASA